MHKSNSDSKSWGFAMQAKQLTGVILSLIFTVSTCGAQQPAATTAPSQTGRVRSSYGNVPLMFEANQGQTDSQVKFLSHGNGYSVFLTAGGMVLALKPSATSSSADASIAPSPRSQSKLSPIRQQERFVRQQKSPVLAIDLAGAAANPTIVGEEPLVTKINYFIGRDPSKWRRNVPTFNKIRYRNVYPGIDLVYYGNNHKIEYDFDLAPGADPTKIQFAVKGADALNVDATGNLVLTKGATTMRFQTPFIYQEAQGNRSRVSGSYLLRDATHVGFSVGLHDNTKPLVIDPVLVYSTFVGGSDDDYPFGIAVDSSGDAFVAGITDSPDFPVATIGSYSSTQYRMFLTELDPTGSIMFFADYFGGTSGNDEPFGVAVDSSGNPYVTGSAMSSDFPVVNAFQSTLAGGQDAFLVKFASDGSAIDYSTYLGGSNLISIGGSVTQYGSSVSVDPSGEAVVVGVTQATNFPTSSAFQSSVSQDQFGDAGEYGFIAKFAPSGSSLVYSTYFAGNTLNASSCTGCFPDSEILSVATDASGNAYVTGYTNTANFPVTPGAFATTSPAYGLSDVGFVSKFSNSGAIAYSTYLGGLTSSLLDAIAVDSTGSAYVTGYDSAGDNFPIVTTSICDPSVSACNGAVIAKLDPTGSTLAYSTFLGTSNNTLGQGIQVDATGDAFIVGGDVAFDLANPIEQYQGNGDVVVAEVDPTASTLLMATFLGGQQWEAASGIAVDSNGAVYVTGGTQSSDFPVTQAAFQNTFGGGTDAFIAKIDPVTVAPAVAMVPYSLEFADQELLTTSAAQTVLLRNMGSQALSITNKRTSGDFAETDTCGTSVPAASSCTFSITFTPTLIGTRTGTLTVTDNAQDSPQTVALTGTGEVDGLDILPGNLRFASSPVGTSSSPQTVTITNNGNSAVTVSGIQTTGNFSTVGNNCTTLAAHDSCTVQVGFTPSSAGPLTGTLQFSDPISGNSQVVSLSGSGTDFVTSASGDSNATVEPGETASYKLNIDPTGGSFSNPVTFSCSGAPALATCTVNPRSITPGANASAVTVTVKTAGATADSHGSSSTVRSRLAYFVFPQLAMFGLLVLSPTSRRKCRAYSTLAVALTLFLVGCGGTSSGMRQSSPVFDATPQGTYRLSVVATSGTLQHTTQLTLTVQ